MFTERDLSGEYDESEAVKITLSDDASEVNGNASGVSIEGNTVTITEEGTYEITAAKHALSGKNSVRIADGTFDITAGGGSKNGKAHTNDMPGGGTGGGFPGGGFPGGNADWNPDGEFPGNPPEDFSEDAMQDGTETDTSGTAPGRPTLPEKPDGENRPDFPDQGQKDESGINAQEKMSFSSASTAWMPPIIPRPEDLG